MPRPGVFVFRCWQLSASPQAARAFLAVEAHLHCHSELVCSLRLVAELTHASYVLVLQDYALPQVVLGLRVDPLAISLSQQILLQLLDALQLPSSTTQPASEPPPPAAAAGGLADTAAAAPSSQMAAVPPPSSEGAATAPVVMVDLQLKAFDLRFSGSSAGAAAAGGGSSGRSASPTSAGRSAAASAVAGGLAALEARLSCGPTSVSVHSLLDGLAVKVRLGLGGWFCNQAGMPGLIEVRALPGNQHALLHAMLAQICTHTHSRPRRPRFLSSQASLTRLLVHDFSPNPSPQPHLPPPVRGQPLPRIARQLAIDRLSVTHTASFGSSSGGSGLSSGAVAGVSGAAAAGPHSTTQLDVWDLSIEGFAGETASFLGRWAVRSTVWLFIALAQQRLWPASQRCADLSKTGFSPQSPSCVLHRQATRAAGQPHQCECARHTRRDPRGRVSQQPAAGARLVAACCGAGTSSGRRAGASSGGSGSSRGCGSDKGRERWRQPQRKRGSSAHA